MELRERVRIVSHFLTCKKDDTCENKMVLLTSTLGHVFAEGLIAPSPDSRTIYTQKNLIFYELGMIVSDGKNIYFSDLNIM